MDWAVIFAGLNGLILLYLQTRLGQRTELRTDNEALREEVKELRAALRNCEQTTRDMWMERYKHLEGLNADAGRPIENQDG